MYSKDSQFPKLAPGDRLGNQTMSNIAGTKTPTYKGGVPEYELPKDSPYREHDSSAMFPAKQGPLQPGKSFKNTTYVPKDVSVNKSAKEEARHMYPSKDYEQYQIYN